VTTPKILLVEDDFLQKKLGVMVLSGISQVDVASNGKEAVEKFSSGHYDLVFMDIGLPEIDGIEATRQIREHDKNTPIIALTAHSDETKKQAALAAGMNDYMVKPITVESAQDAFKKWVKK
jgi:CheY-like chemotaxis protein